MRCACFLPPALTVRNTAQGHAFGHCFSCRFADVLTGTGPDCLSESRSEAQWLTRSNLDHKFLQRRVRCSGPPLGRRFDARKCTNEPCRQINTTGVIETCEVPFQQVHVDNGVLVEEAGAQLRCADVTCAGFIPLLQRILSGEEVRYRLNRVNCEGMCHLYTAIYVSDRNTRGKTSKHSSINSSVACQRSKSVDLFGDTCLCCLVAAFENTTKVLDFNIGTMDKRCYLRQKLTFLLTEHHGLRQ